MSPKKERTTGRNLTIAQRRLEGATYLELAKEFGISKTRIGQILNDEEIKEVLKEGVRQMVRLVPRAVDNYQELLGSDNEAIKLKASKDLLKMTGYAPSISQPIYIQQVNQVNNVITGMSKDQLDYIKWRKKEKQQEIIDQAEEK